ncbi:N-acetyl-D-glucosamine kinase [Streptomyces alboniger]
MDIGATSVDVAVTNAELEVLGHINQPMDVREGPVAVFEQVLAMAAKLKASGLAEGFDGAGSASPDPSASPKACRSRRRSCRGWDGFPVREALSQELGCPVMVDNDVNLMAMGEQHAGVARSVGDFLCVKIGTGIGCGIVVGGEVHRGATGSAGDIGHIQAEPDGAPAPAATGAAWRPTSAARRSPATPRRRPGRGVPRSSPRGSTRRGGSAPSTSRRPPPRVTPPPSTSSARAATAPARSSRAWSASSTPDSW